MSESPSEDLYYSVTNLDTGVRIDLRNVCDVDQLIRNSNAVDVPNVWNQFWQISMFLKIQRDKSSELSQQVCVLSQEGDLEGISALFASGYDINVNIKYLLSSIHICFLRIEDDWTPLHFACHHQHVHVACFLLQQGSFVDAQTRTGKSALHLAIQSRAIVQVLLENDADPNLQDAQLNTPLHYAESVEVVELFLECSKTDPTLKNSMNLTPVEYQAAPEIRNLFKSYGYEASSYSRQSLPGTNTSLPNGRQDHVMRLLRGVKCEQPQESRESSSDGEELVLRKQEEKVGVESFIFHDIIGEGSFGKVYLAEKKDSGKYFAMKVQCKTHIKRQNLTEKVQTERDVLSLMKHPFIVKLNYAFQTEKKLFLAMDFCPGGDLATVLELKQRLTEDVVKMYAAELTLALEALHAKGIVYRDLKPQNIVLDEDGHVLLTDFGLSKKDFESLTTSFCGSPAYLAPEIVGRKGHNKQVDWYCLGVLIYEMLVGVAPYYDDQIEILYDNILRSTLRLPRSLSPEAKDLIVGLLRRNPEKRLGSERDGEEIRQHDWFKALDWQAVYDRKLCMPEVDFMYERQSVKPMKVKFGRVSEKHRVNDWSVY